MAIETRGSMLYPDVERVTKAFVETVLKDSVTVSLRQDSRNVFNVSMTSHKCRHYQQTCVNDTAKHIGHVRNAQEAIKDIRLTEGMLILLIFRS